MPDDILPIFPRPASDEVFEMVDPAEIDLVMAALTKLFPKIKSLTLRDILETTRQDIACLGDDEMLDRADDDEPRQVA